MIQHMAKATLGAQRAMFRMIKFVSGAAILLLIAFLTQAEASALIANCRLKSNAYLKTMPAVGDEHLSYTFPKEVEVSVYDQFGNEWAYVTVDDQDYPATGWVLRSSLNGCSNTRPWKKQ